MKKVLSRTFPPKILLSMPAPSSSSSVLPHIPLPFHGMYFLFLLHFLFPYFPSFLYFPCLSRTSLSKILLSMSAPGPSSNVLLFLFFYSSLPYFSVLWILPFLCLYCDFLSIFFTEIFLKMYLKFNSFFIDLVLVYL